MESLRTKLRIRRYGLISYERCWQLQREIHARLMDGAEEDTLICCQHPTTITLGRSAKTSNLLVAREELEAKGIGVFDVERGGDVTLHNPGQLVLYPLIDLRRRKTDVGWYLRNLEEALIATCQLSGVATFRIPGKTGIWTGCQDGNSGLPEACSPAQRKLASIGVRLSRWCSLHGCALNVDNDVAAFRYINPCGFSAEIMSSLSLETGKSTDVSVVREFFISSFCKTFGFHEELGEREVSTHAGER